MMFRSIIYGLTAWMVMLVWAGAPGWAQTRPSDAQLAQWVDELSDESAPVREASLDGLLHLPADALEQLRMVSARRTWTAAQLATLKPVVVQVYLSGMTYETSRGVGDPRGPGFMGVTLGRANVQWPAGTTTGGLSTSGVVIMGRAPGFGGYAALRDGDIVLQVNDRPEIPLSRMEVLRQMVLSFHPGDRIHLRVLREGQVVNTEVTLSAPPAVLSRGNQAAYEQFLSERMEKAQAYWQAHFANLSQDRSSRETPAATRRAGE